MDTEIQLETVCSAAAQPKVESRLLALPGVESVSFVEGRVAIRYFPENVTRARLCEAVTQEGFRIADSKTAPTDH